MGVAVVWWLAALQSFEIIVSPFVNIFDIRIQQDLHLVSTMRSTVHSMVTVRQKMKRFLLAGKLDPLLLRGKSEKLIVEAVVRSLKGFVVGSTRKRWGLTLWYPAAGSGKSIAVFPWLESCCSLLWLDLCAAGLWSGKESMVQSRLSQKLSNYGASVMCRSTKRRLLNRHLVQP